MPVPWVSMQGLAIGFCSLAVMRWGRLQESTNGRFGFRFGERGLDITQLYIIFWSMIFCGSKIHWSWSTKYPLGTNPGKNPLVSPGGSLTFCQDHALELRRSLALQEELCSAQLDVSALREQLESCTEELQLCQQDRAPGHWWHENMHVL